MGLKDAAKSTALRDSNDLKGNEKVNGGFLDIVATLGQSTVRRGTLQLSPMTY